MGAAKGPPSRRFSISHLVLLVPWVALVIDAWQPIRDNSFLWHVRAGSLQATQGEVLTADPFSFTRQGEPWLTQSWLAELLYGWAEDIAGLEFVPALLLILSTLTFFGIGLIGYRKSGSVPATAFVLILSTLLLISFLVPRPVIFSYLLFVLVVLAWDIPGLRWATPFLVWIWAAMHGSFVIGLGYVGLTLIMKRQWKSLPVAVVSGVATLATAHGIGVVEFLVDFSASGEALAQLSEWRDPEFSSPIFIAFLGGIAFIVIGAYRRQISPRHLWLLIPFLALGLSSVRALPPAWLGLLPLVALALSGLTLGATERFGFRSAAIFAVVVLILPFLLTEEAEIPADRFPIEASGHLGGLRTFHDDRAGGYLIWAGWPEQRVYIDDRAELYGDLMVEYVRLRDGEIDWRPVFEREGIEQALLLRDWDLVDWLSGAGWRTVHTDETYVVLRPE